MNSRTVLIAGGGASGVLVAANLARNSPSTRIVVVEPRPVLGRGMAYSTPCPLHLLNVPAARMSAFPDDPSHFVRWLAARGYTAYSPCSFVPRQIFGEYLASVAEATPLEHVPTEALACRTNADEVELDCANGTTLHGDALVLALGNPAPAPWRGLTPQAAASGRFFPLLWEEAALRPADPDESVLLIGSGLTAVDAVLALRHNGHRGPITMISRRGLLPEAHRLFPCSPLPCKPADSARELARNLRAAAQDAEILHANWRIAVDGVRPQTNALWTGLSLVEQERFLRHLRPYWDVHRHRMAPEIAQEIHGLIETGTLRVLAGRVGAIDCSGDALAASITERSATDAQSIRFGRVVNCTGPECHPARLKNPLIQHLLAGGHLTTHPLRTGAQVNGSGALIDQQGHPSATLFTLGPLRLGSLLETVAIPEIRQQAQDLAQRLTANPSASEQEADREVCAAR